MISIRHAIDRSSTTHVTVDVELTQAGGELGVSVGELVARARNCHIRVVFLSQSQLARLK